VIAACFSHRWEEERGWKGGFADAVGIMLLVFDTQHLPDISGSNVRIIRSEALIS
jgi:hypothetical protein